MVSRKIAAVVTAGALASLSLALAQPALAIPAPGYLADCKGGHGDIGAHRYSVGHNVPARMYNTVDSKKSGTVTANSKIHLYYQARDEDGGWMWAMKAGNLCGYVYTADVVWNKTW